MDRYQRPLAIGSAGVALLGVAGLVAAFRVGETGHPTLGAAFGWTLWASLALLVLVAAMYFFSAAMRRLLELGKTHQPQLAAAKRRVPTLAALLLLPAEATKLTAENAFNGENQTTFLVGVALLLGFWLANELIASDQPMRRRAGYIAWVSVLFSLPTMICLDRQWSPIDLARFAWSLGLSTKLLLAIGLIVFAMAPAVARSGDA